MVLGGEEKVPGARSSEPWRTQVYLEYIEDQKWKLGLGDASHR